MSGLSLSMPDLNIKEICLKMNTLMWLMGDYERVLLGFNSGHAAPGNKGLVSVKL